MTGIDNITIAIGDIHGMAKPFALLLSHLERRFAGSDIRFILLGDLIDRGAESRQVVAMAIKLFERHPRSQLILGNHDAYFLEMLDGTISKFDLNQWVHLGGLEAIQSYLFEPPHDIDTIRSEILERAPRHHAFFQEAVSMVVTARHCFVHAGIDPAVPLAEQDAKTVRWIRKGFLDWVGPLERTVVHGHSITSTFLPEVHSNRIALDTGSYKSGRVAAAIFHDDQVSGFVCAKAEGDQEQILVFDSHMEILEA
jgi:serine/threonine protein phosphatase 1